MLNKNLNYNELIIKARHGSICHQKQLYKICLNIIQPVLYKYFSYCKHLGINREDLTNLMNETFLALMCEDVYHYSNFESYFKRKYEYDVLAILKSNNTIKGRIFCEALLDKEKDKKIDKSAKDDVENDDEVKKYIDAFSFIDTLKKKEELNEKDLTIFRDYLNGYKIKEIGSLFNLSSYKIRNSIRKTIKVIIDLKNFDSSNLGNEKRKNSWVLRGF